MLLNAYKSSLKPYIGLIESNFFAQKIPNSMHQHTSRLANIYRQINLVLHACLFFHLLLGGFGLNAQPLDFQIGPPCEIKLKNNLTKILGKINESYIIVGPEENNFFNLTIFNKNLNPIKTIKANFSKDQKLVYSLKNAWLMEDRIILQTHCFNKAIQQDQYDLWHLSHEGKILKGPVEIARINGNGITVDPDAAPVIGCSRDLKIIYSLTSAVPNYGQSIAGIRFKMFDNELELIYSRTMNFPVENEFARIISADFKNEDRALLMLDFIKIAKPNSRSSTAPISNRKAFNVSTMGNTFSSIPMALEEFPFVHGITALWSASQNKIISVSALSKTFKSGINTILIQKFNESDTTPTEKFTFEIPASFKKNAELNNKKFRDTGNPKRPLKDVMDLSTEILEINANRFSIYATINRVNREVPVGQKPQEVADKNALYTHYTQGSLILNGTWSKGIHQCFENPMDQIINADGFPLPTGIASLPHYENNLIISNDLLENIQRREENFKPKGLNNKNIKNAKSVLTFIDADGRFSFYQPFSNPKDPGNIYPFSVFKENSHDFIFLGTDINGKMRLVKAFY